MAEQWGRRWITVDTSRVALGTWRVHGVMGARYPWYLLSDSPEGQRKEAEISGRDIAADRRPRASWPQPTATFAKGFIYERVPHITLRDIANNAEIDVIWEQLAAGGRGGAGGTEFGVARGFDRLTPNGKRRARTAIRCRQPVGVKAS